MITLFRGRLAHKTRARYNSAEGETVPRVPDNNDGLETSLDTKHGFTHEELDFTVNRGIKHRMGQDALDDGDGGDNDSDAEVRG